MSKSVVGENGIKPLIYVKEMQKESGLPLMVHIGNNPPALNEIAKHFNVSTRTIRADVSALNDLFAGYGAKIVYERRVGYQLKIEDELSFATLLAQKYQVKNIPRTAKERIDVFLLKFLMALQPIKLDDITGEWFVSRKTLQHDISSVRKRLSQYQIILETIPRQGMKLSGVESAVRACITDILWQQFTMENERSLNSFKQDILFNIGVPSCAYWCGA
ncbi:helix-turn-helix domain-containing protein [Photorhabdus tasmaniensis]